MCIRDRRTDTAVAGLFDFGIAEREIDLKIQAIFEMRFFKEISHENVLRVKHLNTIIIAYKKIIQKKDAQKKSL